MKVLGISAYYHDSAASLIDGGNIVCAAQEERFTRIKHDSAFPRGAIDWILKSQGIGLDDLEAIVFYEKPFLKFDRLVDMHLDNAPFGRRSFMASVPIWLKDKIFMKRNLINGLQGLGGGADIGKKLFFSEHHLSHAASAYYPSPFTEALVLTADGAGEWATTSVCIGQGPKLSMAKEIHFPHSLGLLYSAFTYYLGFKVNSGEYKVMGLAPYGAPKFRDHIYGNLLTVFEDGSFKLNMDYFAYAREKRMTNEKFSKLFGRPVRTPESPIEQFHMDLASSIQVVLEEVLVKIVNSLVGQYKIKNLCMAGGVALNCVANARILRETPIENLWVQPAAGDAGGSLGAALAYYFQESAPDRRPSAPDGMSGAYLGTEYADAHIETILVENGLKFTKLDEEALLDKVSELLGRENVIGWFQGKMEFGPRALGSRSILGDARSAEMQEKMNIKIKFRESFRPFAPSVLGEKATEWFDIGCSSPYMLLVADIKSSKRREGSEKIIEKHGFEKLKFPRSLVQAATHVDFSARVQTVHERTNPRYHRLIDKFNSKTGCPMVVNTSFNVRGEPIVCSPQDAVSCFLATDLDALAIGNFLVIKNEQEEGVQALRRHGKDFFGLD